MRAEAFLQKYRILEGLLEERYEGRKMSGNSVVFEYIRDPDSEPVRVHLDLIREIRNILSHNAGSDGDAVVEPSQEMLERLDDIIAYVRRPRRAQDFGTPAERILSAHPRDRVCQLMRSMQKNGYSHIPVEDDGATVGVLSIKSVFDYITLYGPEALSAETRIQELGAHVRLSARYKFVSAETTVGEVRRAFQKSYDRNGRLSAVFVTQSGKPEDRLLAMLTPWDVLSDDLIQKEENQDADGKRKRL